MFRFMLTLSLKMVAISRSGRQDSRLDWQIRAALQGTNMERGSLMSAVHQRERLGLFGNNAI